MLRYRNEAYRPPCLDLGHIGYARKRMKGGADLSEVAQELGVLTRDLDRWLWHWIGDVPILREEPPDRGPMF